MIGKLVFPRKLRLLTPNHFNFVFQQPRRIAMPYITIFSRLNELEYSRIGLTVAKKYIKLAHERNRIKRLIRESFRLRQQVILPTMDFVVIAKKDMVNFENSTLMEALEKLWCRFCH